MRLTFILVFYCLLFCCTLVGFAQPDNPDAGLKAVQAYAAAMGNQSHLYSGTDFKVFPEGEDEHPYFMVSDYSAGTIQYQGQVYSPVDMLYNLASDQVIIEDGATRYNIQLVQQGISSFSLLGHTFESLADTRELTGGFYDVLTSGKTKVLVKREKSLQHKLRADVLQPWYLAKDKIFIKKGDRYFAITSKKALFNCFADKSDAVKQHLKAHRLRFNHAREATCKEAATFYDSQQ